MRPFALVGGVVCGALLVGCSSSSTPAVTADAAAEDAAESDSTIGCLTDPRAQTYTANMKRAGDTNAFDFILVQSDPAPPIRGNNTWTVKVTDPAGAPVTDATLDVLPFMPDHGHGTSVAATVTANGDGSFNITPLYFFMPGLWRVTLTAKAHGVTDTGAFFFCVAG